jgi:hypothetical protein
MTYNELNEMRIKMQQMKKEYEEVIQNFGKEIFNSATKELFENNPKLTSFGWYQYTPYFNDGEECTFRVNRDYLTLNRTGESLDRCGVDYWKDPKYNYTPPDPKDYNCDSIDELISIVEGIDKVLDLFEDDDLSLMFGDHAEITVFRDGRIDIDSYDHD